jgi:hypothetical protein
MSKENPLWGAPRIHGELLKLGFEVAESTVSKYMIGRCGPPSQSWRTFLRNHADAIAAIDLCVVPTLTFERLFALLVVGHRRRQLLWFAVTRNPSAEWLAQQMAERVPARCTNRVVTPARDARYDLISFWAASSRARIQALWLRLADSWLRLLRGDETSQCHTSNEVTARSMERDNPGHLRRRLANSR